jgi:type III secretion protein J
MKTLSSSPVWKTIRALLFTLLFAALLTACGGRKSIVNGIDEKEANEIIVFLAGKNIDAAKVPQPSSGGGGGAKVAKYDIVVDMDKSTEAMALLNQAGYPRRPSQNLLSIFSNQSLVPSELQDKVRFQQGLAEQIAGVIRKIDGVLDAEVRISFPEEDPLNPTAKQGKITASVYVKHSGVLDDPNSHLATKIRRLVAASVTGLDFDNVTIIPDRARYGEINTSLSSSYEPERDFVSLWGVVLAKESVSHFRWLFGSLSVVLLLLLLALIWIGWKLHPLLNKYGGYKELLHIHPIKLEKEEKEAESEEAAKSHPDDHEEGVT